MCSTTKEEYIQVPQVHPPDLSGWLWGRLRWYSLSRRFGFVAGDQDVLLNQENRVVPEVVAGDKHTLDLRITLTGTPKSWSEIPMNSEIGYRLSPNRAKLMAVPWFVKQDVLDFTANEALDQQMQLYLQLPHFAIGPETEQWMYQSNWPFRALREWLVIEQRLRRFRTRTICRIDCGEEGPSRVVRSYLELREFVQSLPEALRSV